MELCVGFEDEDSYPKTFYLLYLDYLACCYVGEGDFGDERNFLETGVCDLFECDACFGWNLSDDILVEGVSFLELVFKGKCFSSWDFGFHFECRIDKG